MKTALKEIYDLTEGLADGAPDASELELLCNRISGIARDAMHPSMGPGIELIAAERERQITAEGWTAAHDDTHADFQMAQAAAAYMEHVWARQWIIQDKRLDQYQIEGPDDRLWPDDWDLEWFKPKGPLQDLIRAGALIAAEIDRLKRKESA